MLHSTYDAILKSSLQASFHPATFPYQVPSRRTSLFALGIRSVAWTVSYTYIIIDCLKTMHVIGLDLVSLRNPEIKSLQKYAIILERLYFLRHPFTSSPYFRVMEYQQSQDLNLSFNTIIQSINQSRHMLG